MEQPATHSFNISLDWRLVCRIIALVFFILASIVAWGTGTVDHSAAFVPLGLAFLTASFL